MHSYHNFCPYHGSHMDWKKLENWENFFQSGKSQEFWTDWKSQGILAKILENWGNFTQLLFLFSLWFLIEVIY